LAKLIATQDVAILMSLGKLVAVAIGATLFHGFITLPLIYMAATKKNPIVFFKAMREALVTALSTSSSSATLPITMRCVEDNLKVNKDVAGFVLPLGATINMDGTALYEAVAVMFAANLYGVELGLGQQIVVFFTAIIAAMGAPGIPSAGMVTLVMVLQSVGLPIEVIALLLPIDRPLDALRTMVNVEGDAIGAAVVDELSKKTPSGREHAT
jgi:Na+/H+-dicarboxylate symporter